jgi:hypothetical protein
MKATVGTKTWPELAGGLHDKLTGRGAEISYESDNLEILVPSSASPGGQDRCPPWSRYPTWDCVPSRLFGLGPFELRPLQLLLSVWSRSRTVSSL